MAKSISGAPGSAPVFSDDELAQCDEVKELILRDPWAVLDVQAISERFAKFELPGWSIR